MNKEQIEAHFRNGNNIAACLLFADAHNLPASEVYGFVRVALESQDNKLKAENKQYKKWLVIPNCPGCHGSGVVTLSEDGGLPAMCDCQAYSRREMENLQKDFDAMKTAYDQSAQALEDCRKKLSTALKVTTESTIRHLQTPDESPR